MHHTKIKSVKYNFIMNAILNASSFIFPFITFPYISRVLLPYGVGKVNFSTSVVSYFSMFAMLGIPTYGVRICAQVRDDKRELSRTVHEILFLNILVMLLVYFVYFGAIWTVPRLQTDQDLFYIMSFMILFNVIGMDWLYKGLELYSYITVRSIAFKAIAVCLMFLFVKQPGDYVIYGMISIIAAVGSNILNLINLQHHIELHPVGDYHFIRHWKAVFFFFLMSVATTVYTNLDMVMLGFMKDDVEVGYYTAAVKIKNILVSFVTSLGTVLLPRVSYYVEHGMKDQFLRTGQKALNFVVLTALPVTVYFLLFSRESILLLSGASFAAAAVPMMLIMPTVLFIGVTNILGIQILVPLGKENLVFYSVLAGAVTDLMINAVCIPRMASAGAALGTTIAEGIVLVVQVIMLKDRIRELVHSIQFGKIATAVLAGATGSLLTRQWDLSAFGILCTSSILFFGIYGGILLITKESFLYEILQQLKQIKRKS